MSGFVVTGVAQVERNLRFYGYKMVAAAGIGLNEAADQVVFLARSYAPVDTGYLRSTIRKLSTNFSFSGAEIIIGTDCDYASYQEYGTVHMEAHPFMRPALDEAAPIVNAAVAAAIRAAMP